MSWVAVAVGVGGAAVGAYSSSQTNKTNKENARLAAEAGQADPRFNALIYGETDKDGKPIGTPGLLSRGQDWYEANRSGMNDQMRQGMNDQWAVLSDPNLRNGYNNMSNLGAGLMGAPVAGNPFSDGRASLNRPFGTQMAPGLLQSSVQGVSQPSGNQPSGMLPVNFGGAPQQVSGPPGPFTALPKPEPIAVEEPPQEPPKPAPYSNRPFDMQSYVGDFYTRMANDTLTAEEIDEYNNITGRNAG